MTNQEKLNKKLSDMLERRTFDQLIEDGTLLNVESARFRLGYSAWGLRRLCRLGKISHIVLGNRYYFLSEYIMDAFQLVQKQ